MTAIAEKLKPQLTALPLEDREELARFLLESLHECPDDGTDLLWESELKKRAEEIRSGQAGGRPLDESVSEIRQRYL